MALHFAQFPCNANSSAIYILIKNQPLDRTIKSKTFDRALDSAEHFLRTQSDSTFFSRAYIYIMIKALVS